MNIKQQQSQLLSAIFSLDSLQKHQQNSPSERSVAGLSIYQRSLLANASRALAITFATVHSFIGKIAFTQLVTAYLKKHLKTQFDWGELGGNFANFIQQQPLPNHGVLAAIAALDFACHQAERAENVEQNLATLTRLSDIDAYQLKLNFSAGFQVITLDYPVDLIITDISNADERSHHSKPTLSYIAKQLSHYEKGQYYLLIWRPSFQAQYQQVSQQEYQWLALWQLAHLSEGTMSSSPIPQLSIGSALDRITHKSFSIVDWLPKAIEQQLIQSISTLAPS